ncbi:MAG: hypothetical protein MR567_02155 [Oscillospiraceae bacterium]|nr:hypothetical protein [Oscillospiraceae bacterium]
MKKIIKRICLGLLIFIVVVVSALCVFLFTGGEKPTVFIPTVTDASGTAYGVVEGDDGETMIVVTDKNGDRYAAHTNADGTPGETVTQINDQVDINQLPQNNKGPVIDDTISGNNFSGQVITGPNQANTGSQGQQDTANAQQGSTNAQQGSTNAQQGSTNAQQGSTNAQQSNTGAQQGNTNTQQGSTNAQQGSTNAQQGQQNTTNASSGNSSGNGEYKIARYKQMFMSNAYLMEFTTNDPDIGDTPVTFATKNGNFVMDATMDKIKCKILYIKSKDTTYLLIDNVKKYSKLPEDMFGGSMNMDEMNMMAGIGESDFNAKNITVSEVTINGQKLTCESYKAKDGSTMKYYFSGDTLVRIDSIDTKGQEFSTFITRITSDVPDSTFEIPKNYSYFNLSWLGKLGDLGSDDSSSKKDQ